MLGPNLMFVMNRVGINSISVFYNGKKIYQIIFYIIRYRPSWISNIILNIIYRAYIKLIVFQINFYKKGKIQINMQHTCPHLSLMFDNCFLPLQRTGTFASIGQRKMYI